MKVKEMIKKAGKFISDHKYEIATTALCITLGVVFRSAASPHEFTGWADFVVGDKPLRITDEMVYQEVKKNLNFLERLNAKKVVEDALGAFAEISP